MAILVMLNNFMHDFSAAGWLFGAVLLWIVRRKGSRLGVDGARFIVQAVRRLMALCLVGIVVCGAFRAMAYREYEWNAAAGDAQVPVLMAKHILFLLVFLVGLYEFVRAGRSARAGVDDVS